MSERPARLRVRYYPAAGAWTCIVQRVGADGMPSADVLSATGKTKDEARDHALSATDDAGVREALEASVH